MELGGIDTLYMQNGRVGGQTRVHSRGGGEGALPPPPPPPRNGKKDVVRRNFNLFHLCFTNEIRGDRQTLHTCKMEGGGRIGACLWWERGGLAPPLKNEKKRLSEEILNAFTYVLLMKLVGIDITAYMQNRRGWVDRRLSMVGGGGRRGGFAPPRK